MSLEVYEFVATVISVHQGPVKGRTHLQKLCYFVSKLTNQSLGYEPYYYGPYSAEVASATAELVAHGVLEEIRQHYGGFLDSVFDSVRYAYRLEADCLFIRQLQELKPRDVGEVVEATKQVLDMPMARSASSLAVAAKVHSILERRTTSMSPRELVQAARKMGWEISEVEVEAVINSLAELRLVERTQEPLDQ